MIEEQGTIIETRGEIAIIKAKRGAGCDSCGSKEMCHPSEDEDMLVDARNPIDAPAGSEVIFTVPASTVLKAGALVYLMPLLCFIAGIVIGQIAAPELMPERNKDLVSAFLGFAFVIAAFGFLRIYGRKEKNREQFRPTVVKVLK